MSRWEYRSAGIPDSRFIRGDIPMTKEEVRALTISKLRLKEDSLIWDIGAGTGSLTVESALAAKSGRVWAVEREVEGVGLIKENLSSFEIENVKVIHGEAPDSLSELEKVDRVIIGGSGGRLEEILEVVDLKLVQGGRIVINAITLDTLTLSLELLKRLNYEMDICQVGISRVREVGNYKMLKGLNPVYIISGEKV